MATPFPIEQDYDKHIDPLQDGPEEDKSYLDEILGNVIENEDGSATILDDEDETAELNSDFYANLAEEIEIDAGELLESIDKDKLARARRDKQYEEGIRRSGLGDDAPGGAAFDGASKVVHPVLAESCVDYAARAIKEVFPISGPVKTHIEGIENEEKLDAAEKKANFLNWQATKQIPEFRTEMEQLLTQLPMGGSQYLKFWFDASQGRPVCEFIPIDDIFVPYASTSFYTSQRVTHKQDITEYEFNRRVRSGLYLDIENLDAPMDIEQTASAKANDKVEGKELDAYNEDGLRTVYEISTYLELDDPETDGEYAPYIVTIDYNTEQVLGIYRNWAENDVRRRKLDWLVEFKFIPWRGAYGIGLPHLIGGLSAALTGALRALMDSAHINNAPTMLKLKGGRISGQNTSVEVTQVAEIEGPPGVTDIRQLAMPMPFNQPSPVLFSLLGFLENAAKGVVSTSEEVLQNIGNQTPVGTTTALIEQGSTTYAAIHARLHGSMSTCLEILCRINAAYLDPAELEEDYGSEVPSAEFFAKTKDITPVTDPRIFSEAQRIAQNQGVLQMMQDPSVPWNKVEAYKRMLKLLNVPNPELLLPAEPKPLTADPMIENTTVIAGKPIAPKPEQDHLAHIQGHLAYVEAPFILQNPMVPAPALMQILDHVSKHMEMHFQQQVTQLVPQIGQAMMMSGQQPTSPDQVTALAIQEVSQMVSQQLAPGMQAFVKVQGEVQKRMPQPPQDPAVAAQLQIGMAEIQRKTQEGQAKMQFDAQKMQMDAQKDQQQYQIDMQKDAAQQQFDMAMAQSQAQATAQLELVREQGKMQIEQMKMQLEMQKNEANNYQHQVTELMKNHEDNQTALQIEALKQQMQSAVQEVSQVAERARQPEVINDPLSVVANGLTEVLANLNRPKSIVRDEQGNIVGVQ